VSHRPSVPQVLAGPVDIHVGRKISEVMRECGLSNQQACKALHISLERFDAYCAGRERVGGRLLVKLCALTGRPPLWFFEDYKP
jgi:plasmid maintenance system antidote protein VapI